MSWCDFAAGWAGGICGTAVGHPFDTLKVRQQAFRNSGLTHLVLDCVKNEGPRGLFKGLLYPMASSGGLNSIFFGVYGVSLRGLTSLQGKEKSGYTDIYLAGCSGGFAALVVACPIDLAKIKLQTQTGHEGSAQYKGPYDVLRSLYKKHGIRGWYQGLTIMTLRDIPAWGLYMVLYEVLKQRCSPDDHLRIAMAGGMAGVVSWMSIIPLDVVKSRIQADNLENPRYTGIADCLRQCYREGGIRIFSRGLLVTALRAFPVNGVTFVVYEYLLSRCQQFHFDV